MNEQLTYEHAFDFLPRILDETVIMAQKGDQDAQNAQDAWQVIFDAYNMPLQRYFQRFGCSLQEAEDLTGWTFLKLVEKIIPGFKEEGDRLTHSVSKIARNKSINNGRDQRRHPLVQLYETLPDNQESVESVVTRENEIEQVITTMETLSPLHREVIELRFFQELNIEQTSEQLHVSIEATKARRHRAIDILRKRLEEQFNATSLAGEEKATV